MIPFLSVERLLMEGVNPDSHNEDGLTPLHQASFLFLNQLSTYYFNYSAQLTTMNALYGFFSDMGLM
jgi:ankyrin repeat protein